MTATLPTALAYGTVTWTAVQPVADTTDPDTLPDPVPVTGTVTFTPSASVLLAAGDPPVTVVAAPLTYTLADDGTLRDPAGNPGVTLVATDSPGVTPTGWTWTVAYRLNNGLTRGSFSFALPAGETVDLTTVAPVSASGGTPVIQGPPGPEGPEGPQGDPGEIQADAVQSVTLRSPATRTADTSRLRVISYQKQEPENSQNGGEGLWLDLADARAKNMLTWRLAFDTASRLPLAGYRATTDADLHRIVWAGAHYYAQDQADYNNPTDIHGHWSVEVPDAALALRTRFEIRYAADDGTIGLDKTIVQTATSDLVVDASNGQVLRLRTGPGAEKAIEWANNEWGTVKRWRLRTTGNETGSNAGSDIAFARYNDTGTAVTDEPLSITRSSGRVNIGGAAGSAGGATIRRNSAGQAVLVDTNYSGAAGATILAATPYDAASRLLSSSVTAETTARFVAFADGKHEWGPGGTTGRDANLYRSAAGLLATDTALRAGTNLLVNTTETGGGTGVLGVANAATVPTTNPTGGVVVYAEGGALKVRDPAGTVATLGGTGATPPASPLPADQGMAAWAFDPDLALNSSTTALTGGVLTLVKVRLAATATLTTAALYVVTAGATLTAGQCSASLYNAAGTLLGSTADQATNWQSTGAKAMTLTPASAGSLTGLTAGTYYVALLANGTTMPALARANGQGPLGNINLTAGNYRHATYGTAQTAPPATITMASQVSSSIATWAAVW